LAILLIHAWTGLVPWPARSFVDKSPPATDQWQCRVDFEINDALNKLPALKLVNETNGQISVAPI